MEFEWEPSKAKSNLRKHAIPFDYAIRVFLDENRLEQVDSRTDYRETRWITIGLINNQEIVVVYTVRKETIRIISARKANRHERNDSDGFFPNRIDDNNLLVVYQSNCDPASLSIVCRLSTCSSRFSSRKTLI